MHSDNNLVEANFVYDFVRTIISSKTKVLGVLIIYINLFLK